jgi:hypothetical protein
LGRYPAIIAAANREPTMAAFRFHASALLVLLIPLVLGVAAGSASAQQPTQPQADAIRQSCRSDYQAHCASVPTGGSAALRCLQQNRAVLSSACRTAVSATEGSGASYPPAAASQDGPAPTARPSMTPRQQAMMMRNACGGDFRTHCRGVALGGGRALACLADHSESLSAPCREALAAARGR